jgi:hypothetical protein
LLLEADVGKTVIEDYAACLEFRFDDFQVIEDTKYWSSNTAGCDFIPIDLVC